MFCYDDHFAGAYTPTMQQFAPHHHDSIFPLQWNSRHSPRSSLRSRVFAPRVLQSPVDEARSLEARQFFESWYSRGWLLARRMRPCGDRSPR